jgi:hypothetical protein
VPLALPSPSVFFTVPVFAPSGADTSMEPGGGRATYDGWRSAILGTACRLPVNPLSSGTVVHGVGVGPGMHTTKSRKPKNYVEIEETPGQALRYDRHPHGGGLVETSAVVDPTAYIHATAYVDPGAVVGEGAHIGEGAWVDRGAVVRAEAVVGAVGHVGAGAVIGCGAVLGARVKVGPAARVAPRVRLDADLVVPGEAVVSRADLRSAA